MTPMLRSRRLRALPGVVVVPVLLLLLRLSLGAQQSPPVDVTHLAIPGGAAAVAPALLAANGEVEVWIALADPSVAGAIGPNAKRGGGLLTPTQQREYARGLESKQEALVAEVRRLGGRELARVKNAHNAVAIRVDASQVPAISQLPGVVTVRPVRNYQADLSETVPYIGASRCKPAASTELA